MSHVLFWLVLKQDSSQLFGEPTICSLNPQPKSAKTSLRGTTEPFQHMERRAKILLMMMMMMMMMMVMMMMMIIIIITDITELALLVINY